MADGIVSLVGSSESFKHRALCKPGRLWLLQVGRTGSTPLSPASVCKPARGSSRTPSRLSQECVLLCRLLCCSWFVRLQMSRCERKRHGSVHSGTCWRTSLGKGGFLESFGSSFMPDASATAAQLKGLFYCFYGVCTFTFGYSFDWKVHTCVHIS